MSNFRLVRVNPRQIDLRYVSKVSDVLINGVRSPFPVDTEEEKKRFDAHARAALGYWLASIGGDIEIGGIPIDEATEPFGEVSLDNAILKAVIIGYESSPTLPAESPSAPSGQSAPDGSPK